MARSSEILFVHFFCSAARRPIAVRPIHVLHYFRFSDHVIVYSSAGSHSVHNVQPHFFLDTVSSVFVKFCNW